MTFELSSRNHKPKAEADVAVKSVKHSTTSDLSSTNHEEDVEAGNSTIQIASTIATGVVILKIPALTWYYWGEKMTATTFGETFADFWSQTLGLGYGATSAVLISMFLLLLGGQLYVKTYIPPLFWSVMATSSIAGTLVSDFIDRTLHWGYPLGMGVLLSILAVILGLWKLSGLHMNVSGSMNRTQECFYWAAILTSNTLGTALGDFLADSLDWGFALTAGILGAILVICALLAVFTKFNPVVLFWVAFILTRPFGASFGDLLTKSTEKGGLDLGTGKASLVIFALFILFFGYELHVLHKKKTKEIINEETDEAEEVPTKIVSDEDA